MPTHGLELESVDLTSGISTYHGTVLSGFYGSKRQNKVKNPMAFSFGDRFAYIYGLYNNCTGMQTFRIMNGAPTKTTCETIDSTIVSSSSIHYDVLEFQSAVTDSTSLADGVITLANGDVYKGSMKDDTKVSLTYGDEDN